MKRALWLALLLTGCTAQDLGRPKEMPAPTRGNGVQAPTGGTDFGGGGDRMTVQETAHWFPMREEVPVCFRIALDFGLSPVVVREVVYRTFDRWNRYVDEKKLSRTAYAIHLAEKENCEDAELQFLFGEWDPILEAARNRYHDPVSFAHKPAQGRASFWFSKEALSASQAGGDLGLKGFEALVLHEAGHAYGNGHVPGTIMTEHIVAQLPSIAERWPGEIDHDRQLLVCTTCPLSFAQTQWDSERLSDRDLAFRILLDRRPVGQAKVEFYRNVPSLIGWTFLTIGPSAGLKLSDERGSAMWHSFATSEVFYHADPFSVFRWVSGTTVNSPFHGSLQYRIELSQVDGAMATVALGVDPIVLTVLQHGEEVELARP